MTYTITKNGYKVYQNADINNICEDGKSAFEYYNEKQNHLDDYKNNYNAQSEIKTPVRNDMDYALQLETPPAMEHVYHSFGGSSPIPDDNDRPLEERKVLELEREPGCFRTCLDFLKNIFCCMDDDGIEDIAKLSEITQDTYYKAFEKGKDRAKAFKKADEKAYKIIQASMTLVSYSTYNDLLFIQNHSPIDASRQRSISEQHAKIIILNKMRDFLEDNAIFDDEDLSPPHNNEKRYPDFTALIQNAAHRAMQDILKKLFDDNLDPGFAREVGNPINDA